MFVNSLEAVLPEIAAVVQEGDIVSEFTLLQQYPKLQREVLQLPQVGGVMDLTTGRNLTI